MFIVSVFCRDEEDDLLDDREMSDDENAMVPAMDGSEAFHQVVKEMLMNGHQVKQNETTHSIKVSVMVD